MSDDDFPELRHRHPFTFRAPLAEIEARPIGAVRREVYDWWATWDQPDSNPLGDVAAFKRAVERTRWQGTQPNRLIVPAAYTEWPLVLMWYGYETFDRTRPWPRIVLFPRWTALADRIRYEARRARRWLQERTHPDD